MFDLIRRRTKSAMRQQKLRQSKRFIWVVCNGDLVIGFGESSQNNDGLGVRIMGDNCIAYIKPAWVVLAQCEVFGKDITTLSPRKCNHIFEAYSRLTPEQICVSVFEKDREKYLHNEDKILILSILNKELGV